MYEFIPRLKIIGIVASGEDENVSPEISIVKPVFKILMAYNYLNVLYKPSLKVQFHRGKEVCVPSFDKSNAYDC